MNAITLVPLGNADRRLVADLGAQLMMSFGSRVTIHEGKTALDPFHDHTRLQYNSTLLLRHLATEWAENNGHNGRGDAQGKLLAVASEDLFIPILTFVFGEAMLGGHAAVVSYHRLQNERYGLREDRDLLFRRLVKEAVHEIGHTFGLTHCTSSECVMRSSTDVEEIDLKGEKFCTHCAGELAGNVQR